jgi:multidrug efflux pump subunit AcrA (membrane-fusion protein)
VTSIAAGADEKNRVFAIEVTVPNPKSYLKPGMIASLTLSGVEEAPAPSVPLAAVVADPSTSGRYCVFIASEVNGKWTVHLRPVTLGETHESDVVVEGVRPGEKIVVVGAADLKDGDLVQVLR